MAGPKNSSLTRVQPFFTQVKDPHIARKLLECLDNSLAKELAGRKSLELTSIRFEQEFPAPHAFLEWLVNNPDKMEWNHKGKEQSRKKREELFGRYGSDAQMTAKSEALNKLGDRPTKKDWFRFEGNTRIDCCLETEDLIIFIEGKRTEPTSRKINWFRKRHQIVRNLEVARELAERTKREYAVLAMVEGENDVVLEKKDLIESLPHYTDDQRNQLKKHFLGCITWKTACEKFGIKFNSLPETLK